ncbi:MAG: tetratricopeptide repeat protein [Oligoflexales bacterium]|nr:tetratricopeptide repeat protein [Oligoflexales bacterium]
MSTSCYTLKTDTPPEPKGDKEGLLMTKMSLIKRYLDKGQASVAWDHVRQLYQSHPEHPDILNLVGLTHLALNNEHKAAQVFAKAYKLMPKTSYGLNLSSAYISIGSFKKARKLILRLTKTSKKYKFRERLWHNLALTYEKENQLSKAHKFYQKAIKINPNFLLSLLNLGRLYKITNKDARAMRYYKKASQVCLQCFEPVNELATYFINQGKFGRAISVLNRYLKGSKADADSKSLASAKNLISLAKNIKARKNRNLGRTSKR